MFTHASRRRGFVASALLGLVAAPLAVGFAAAPVQANTAGTNLVIAEVYGGGGTTSASASYKQDFVELYNPTSSPISLNGWSIQYRSATGSAANATALPNKVVPANDRFLIGMGTVSTGGADLPAADATASTANLAAASGLIILSNGTTAVTAPTGNIPAGTSGVVDAVGYGATVTSFELARQATVGTTTISYARNATGADGDDNSTDFSTGTPTPQAAGGSTAPITPLAATNPGDQTATAGTAITSFTLAATDGIAPYTWTATGLPDGVTASAAGAVSGTPTAAGTYDVTATATDSATPAATASTSFTLSVTAAPAGPVDIQILATNDFHGRIQNDTTTASAGAAVLAGAVKQLRGTNPNTVFAAAGDLIGASTFESFIQKDKPTIDALNEAGLEVSAVGNHEFDQGYNDLVNRVMAPYDAQTNPYGGASWKYLGANVKFKADDTGALDGTWIKEMAGVEVGFIGAVTEHLPELVSPGGIADIKVTDTVAAANAAANDLKTAGADVVVLLVHEGAAGTDCATINTDTTSDFGKITSGMNDNVDAIVSGHTHLSYNCSQTVPGWSARPVTTRPIVSAGQHGMGLNQITYTVDNTGIVTDKTQALLPLKNGSTGSTFNYPVDSATQTIVMNAVNNANVLGAQPLGTIGGAFSRAKLADGVSENRGGESALGNLVAEIQRWATSDPAFGAAQIAFMNPGGLRADLVGQGTAAFPRVVTYKDAANVQPFANTLVNEDLTGARIKAALEQQWQPGGASRPFLKLGISKGFTYTYDPNGAQGSRITAMYLHGTQIDLGATYSVTTNAFLSTGGDNFTALNGAGRKQDTGRTDLQAQVDYFAALGSGANGVPVDRSQRSVGTSFPGGAPASYPAGGDVTVNLSSLSMTGPGDARDTLVAASIDGTAVGSFPVTTILQTSLPGFDEVGTGTVVVTLPGNLAGGDHELLITGDRTGTEARIPFTSDAPASVATTVSGTADPIVHGTDGTVTVTVAPSTATGTVELRDGETLLGTGNVTTGTASITVEGTALAVGSHDLTLNYLGDAGFEPSTGTVRVTVVQAPTTVTGTSDPIVYGHAGAVAVSVTSSGGTPTGEVELRDGATVVGTATLDDGAGTITVPSDALAVGEHTLTLAYLGATSFESSTGTVTVTVAQAPTTIIGTSDPIIYGTDGTVTVTISPSGATGTVQLRDGETLLGTGNMVAGTASITVEGTALAVGSHDLTLRYLGATGYAPANGTVTINVTRATPAVAVTAAPSTVEVKSSNEVSVRVRAAGFSPTGEVQILSGNTVVGRGTLSAGVVSIDVGPYSDTGAFALTVNYLGDATTTTGSGSVSVKVVKQTPSMKVTAPKTVKKKAAPTIKVVLTGVGADVRREVTFRYHGKTITKYAVDGKVTLRLAKLTETTRVRVKYAGNDNFNAVTRRVRIIVEN